MSILFKNGTVLDYASSTEEVFDVLVNEEGKIEKIAKTIDDNDAKVKIWEPIKLHSRNKASN